MHTDVAHARPSRVRLALAFLLAAAAALSAGAHAQERDVDQVLAALEASAASIVDVSFVLEGSLIDADGQAYQLEVEVLAMPAERAAGLYILQPDAIADNQLVITGDEVRSYTYLTNQVSLFDADDPDAFGGLIDVEEGGELPIDLDLAAVFAGWDASLVGEEEADGGTLVTLRFDNLDPGAEMRYVVAAVRADDWSPRRLTFYRADDELFADLYFQGWTRDQGLTLEDVTYLPDDAEVLDRRR